MYKYFCETRGNLLMCVDAKNSAYWTSESNVKENMFIEILGVENLNGPFSCEFPIAPYSSSVVKTFIYKCFNYKYGDLKYPYSKKLLIKTIGQSIKSHFEKEGIRPAGSR